MSDFVLVVGSRPIWKVVEGFFSWSAQVRTYAGTSYGLQWMVSRTDDPELWGPAHDPETGVRAFVAGRLAFDECEWRSAESSQFMGGLAARIILSRYLESPEQVSELINGAGVIVVDDPRKREAHLWQDPVGAFPVCATQGPGCIYIGSHPDCLAALRAANQLPLKLDEEAVEEFIVAGAAIHPKTYWKEIVSLDPGTWRILQYGEHPNLVLKSTYWHPAFKTHELLDRRRQIADHLTKAFLAALEKRTLKRLGPVAVLLSSGADSRLCVFGTKEKQQVTAYTYFDEQNPELNGSQALAKAAGVTHQALKRDPSYYVDYLEDNVRLSGGMWSLESSHHYGMLIEKRIPEQTLLTGCYADYLLKGIAINGRLISVLGKSLPLKTFSPTTAEWHHPHIQNLHCAQAVSRRMKLAHLADGSYTSAIDRLVSETQRTTPLWREPDAAGRLCLHRLAGWDPVFVDRGILDIATRMHPRRKMNGIEFGMAVSRVTGSAGRSVLNNNYSAPVGSAEIERIAHFLANSLKRKLKRKSSQGFKNSVATVGSWPNFFEVFRTSESTRRLWDNDLRNRADSYPDVISEVLKSYTYDKALENITLLMRILTWVFWHDGIGAHIDLKRNS